MKPYGNKRIENLVCTHGCCCMGCIRKGTLGVRVPRAVWRRARKRARRLARMLADERGE